MPAPQVITLLTDFGTTDAYVGIVKGILLARAPNAGLSVKNMESFTDR